MRDFGKFSVMEGEFNGYRMVATIREELQNRGSKSPMPWFLGFSTSLSNPTKEGLPTAQEADELNRWEDILEQEVSSHCKSVFVGRVTWKGNRELLYYVDKPEEIVAKVDKLIGAHTLRPFAYRYEHDPNWSNIEIYLR